MNIIKFINNANINGINVFKLKEQLLTQDSNSYNQNNIILYEGKVVKCVKNYYIDPETGKKIKQQNIVNECNKIRRTFGVENNVASHCCKKCHIIMINKFLSGEINKIK